VPLRPVIDRQGFLELGYGRQTWDELLRALPAVRPNGHRGRKAYLYVEDVERYLAERTEKPERTAV
jgi:hypothetical protein